MGGAFEIPFRQDSGVLWTPPASTQKKTFRRLLPLFRYPAQTVVCITRALAPFEHGRIQPVYILQYNREYRHTDGYTTGWYLWYSRTTGTVVRDTNLMVLTIVPVVRLYHKYQPVV